MNPEQTPPTTPDEPTTSSAAAADILPADPSVVTPESSASENAHPTISAPEAETAPEQNPAPMAEAAEPAQLSDSGQPTESPAAVDPTPIDGTPSVASAASPSLSVTDTGKRLGIVALILSLIGLSIPGLVVGIIGLRKSKATSQTNGLALAGVILGGIGTIIGLLFIVSMIGIATMSTAP